MVTVNASDYMNCYNRNQIYVTLLDLGELGPDALDVVVMHQDYRSLVAGNFYHADNADFQTLQSGNSVACASKAPAVASAPTEPVAGEVDVKPEGAIPSVGGTGIFYSRFRSRADQDRANNVLREKFSAVKAQFERLAAEHGVQIDLVSISGFSFLIDGNGHVTISRAPSTYRPYELDLIRKAFEGVQVAALENSRGHLILQFKD